MSLNGNSDETNGYYSVIKNGVAANSNLNKAIFPPIGSIIGWCKTFDEKASGTTDGTTANKIVDSGASFTGDGIIANMVVYNGTDDTFSAVSTVDDDNNITIDDDIFVSGEDYYVYTTPELPDGWVECDGTALSDSDSPFNGATLPDLNSTQRFIRGSITSGTTGGSDEVTGSLYDLDGGGTRAVNAPADNRPAFYEVVMIMRVK